MADRGDWMITHSGRAFYPLDPRPEDVSIEDISHALSHLCRYGGHTSRYYSVAEHSILLAEWALHSGRARSIMDEPARRSVARTMLLHDAAEAYLVDIPSPIKRLLPRYRDIEYCVLRAVQEKFGVSLLDSGAMIKDLDRSILADEAAALLPPAPVGHTWPLDVPLGVQIVGLTPKRAKYRFLDLAAQLGISDGAA